MALLEGWPEAAMKSWRLGSPLETPDRWRQISPAYFSERIKAPLLMQMAEEEYWAALEYYVPMVRAGAAVEMYAFPQERSEEHTSVLQSVMRSSYAVFCLRK